jgi:hypothetical protein
MQRWRHSGKRRSSKFLPGLKILPALGCHFIPGWLTLEWKCPGSSPPASSYRNFDGMIAAPVVSLCKAPCGIAPRHDVLLCRHARGTAQRMATYRHCALGRVGNTRLDLFTWQSAEVLINDTQSYYYNCIFRLGEEGHCGEQLRVLEAATWHVAREQTLRGLLPIPVIWLFLWIFVVSAR